MRVLHGQRDGLLAGAAHRGLRTRHLAALGIGHDDLRGNAQCGLSGGFDVHLNGGLRLGDFLQSVGGTPLRQMRGGRLDEPDVAVDARARVPARVGIPRVVDAHGQHVVLARLVQVGSHVVEERGVAVGSAAQQVAVQIDLRAVVDAFEVDEAPTPFPSRGEGCFEMFPVPADAAGQIACAGGQLGRHDALGRPVVGKRKAAPLRVVEGGERLGVFLLRHCCSRRSVMRRRGRGESRRGRGSERGCSLEHEEPLVVESFRLSERYLCTGLQRCQDQECEKEFFPSHHSFVL